MMNNNEALDFFKQNLKRIECNHMFNTSIGVVFNTEHDGIEEELKEHCLNIRETVKSGGNDWLAPTYNTSTTNHSVYKDKKFYRLNQWVDNQVQQYIDFLGIKLRGERYIPFEKDGWFNIYEKGDYQEYHNHPCIISAIYYLSSDRAMNAKTYFKSPVQEHYPISYDSEYGTSGRATYYPERGKLLIFRGFLEHCVEKEESDNIRISLAYNYE